MDLNIGQLSEPATKLIEVLAQGVGGLYQPIGTVRAANAEAKAAAIRAQANLVVGDIKRRAALRAEFQEIRYQENLDAISELALQELPASVSNDSVETDWVDSFVEQAKRVSDTEMRKVWARVLASEVARPGSFSRRTLTFLKDLEKHEAIAFTELCSYLLISAEGMMQYLPESSFFLSSKIRIDGRLEFTEHFMSIGLISAEPLDADSKSIMEIDFNYFGRRYKFTSPQEPKNNLLIKEFSFQSLSKTGRELASICGAELKSEYIEELSAYLSERYLVSVSEYGT